MSDSSNVPKAKNKMSKVAGRGLSLQNSEKARAELLVQQRKEITQLYENLLTNISKELESLSFLGSDAKVSQVLQKSYLQKMQKQVNKAFKDQRNKIEGIIKKGIFETAAANVKDNNQFLSSIGFKIKDAFFYVPQDIVECLASGKVYDKNWTLSKAIWNITEKNVKDINYIIAEGVAANKGSFDIAKDLEQFVKPPAKRDFNWSKVYPNSSKTVDYNAQRLARTMTNHAYQQSLTAVTGDNPFVTGIKWKSALSARSCELCKSRDGTIYKKDEVPMDHPNGLCSLLPVVPDDPKDIADRISKWVKGESDPELDKYANMAKGNTKPSIL